MLPARPKAFAIQLLPRRKEARLPCSAPGIAAHCELWPSSALLLFPSPVCGTLQPRSRTDERRDSVTRHSPSLPSSRGGTFMSFNPRGPLAAQRSKTPKKIYIYPSIHPPPPSPIYLSSFSFFLTFSLSSLFPNKHNNNNNNNNNPRPLSYALRFRSWLLCSFARCRQLLAKDTEKVKWRYGMVRYGVVWCGVAESSLGLVTGWVTTVFNLTTPYTYLM